MGRRIEGAHRAQISNQKQTGLSSKWLNLLLHVEHVALIAKESLFSVSTLSYYPKCLRRSNLGNEKHTWNSEQNIILISLLPTFSWGL